MHQAFDARLDLDEAAVIGDVADLAQEAGGVRVTTGDVVPRILAQLLQAEADAVALAVELEHADVHLLADFHHLGRMAHALPCHVGDVQQAVDAAEVDERTVIGEVLDHALDDRAFLQAFQQLLALLGELGLDDGAARNDHVVALAIQLDDLELEFLALEVDRIADRTHVHQRTWQERTDVLDVDGEAALDLAGDLAGHGLVAFHGFFQLVPHHGALGLLARQHGFAEAILECVQRDLDLVADLHFELTVFTLELLDRHDAFGLQAGVDDDHVRADLDHLGGDDAAGLELGELFALFEQFCKTFSHWIGFR